MLEKDKISIIIIDSFNQEKPIQTIDTLLKSCKCSIRTLRRRIKKNHIICSYNKNSKFYTLPFLSEFNQYGIWHYKEVSFSKWGNLFETIIYLSDHSKMGYTSHELREILQVRIYDSIRILYRAGRIRKIRIQSQNVYFSGKEEVAKEQIKKRNIRIEKVLLKKKYPLPETAAIITILVEIILDRKATSQEISKRLKKKEVIVTPTQVETVIEYYQLKKKLSTESDSGFDD